MSLFPRDSEWHIGWRIALACAIANGTGISLTYYCFSMFVAPMTHDLGITRAQFGQVQSLVILAAFGAPLVGMLTDRMGFRSIFLICSTGLAGMALAQGFLVSGAISLGLTIALSGLFGSGVSSITLTRPINAHFHRFRGRALGLVGIGVSLTTILVPPFLQILISDFGWRAGFLALAALGGLIGVPLVLWIMPNGPATAPIPRQRLSLGSDRTFLRERDFWVLCAANLLVGIGTNGAVAQLHPMIVEHVGSPAIAALGLSVFAAGQFVGKLGGGWLLDRFEPRFIAAAMILIPGCGFILLAQSGFGMIFPALIAAGMIGLLQGADIDIFSFFIGRRFSLGSYGAAFGVLHGLGWFGTVLGINLFSQSKHLYASYAPAQYAVTALLVLGALLLVPLRLPERPQS